MHNSQYLGVESRKMGNYGIAPARPSCLDNSKVISSFLLCTCVISVISSSFARFAASASAGSGNKAISASTSSIASAAARSNAVSPSYRRAATARVAKMTTTAMSTIAAMMGLCVSYNCDRRRRLSSASASNICTPGAGQYTLPN